MADEKKDQAANENSTPQGQQLDEKDLDQVTGGQRWIETPSFNVNVKTP